MPATTDKIYCLPAGKAAAYVGISRTSFWRLVKNRRVTPIFFEGDQRPFYRTAELRHLLKPSKRKDPRR